MLNINIDKQQNLYKVNMRKGFLMSYGKRIDWSKYDHLIIKHLSSMTTREFVSRFCPDMKLFNILKRARKLGIVPIRYTPTKEHRAKTSAGAKKHLDVDKIQIILNGLNKESRLALAKQTKSSIHMVNRIAREHGIEIDRSLEKRLQAEGGRKNSAAATRASVAKWQDEEFAIRMRAELSARSKEWWKDENYRLKVRNGIRKTYDSTDLRDRLSAINKQRYVDNAKVRKALERGNADRTSKLNDDIAIVLDGHKINYEREFELANYLFDFKIGNILLEVHGDYWHKLPNNQKNDRAKATIVARYFPEYELRVIWESEFRTVRGKQRLLHLLGIATIAPTQISLRDIRIADKMDSTDLNKFLVSYHYLGTTNRRKIVFAATLHGEAIAVAVFGQPIRQNVGFENVLELVRLCRSPYVHNKNLMSFFLARCVKKLRETKYENLIAYADTRLHEGTVYHAAGWEFLGESKPDYQYRSADNIPMHKKTLYNRAKSEGLREREYAEKYGYEKTKSGTRLKFVKKL